jgi:hypothetical protein
VINREQEWQLKKQYFMKGITLGLFAVLAACANAMATPTYYTFTFEADAGQPDIFNGSRVTIVDDGLNSHNVDIIYTYSWNLIESGVFDLTPQNSTSSSDANDISFGYVNSTRFEGSFDVSDNSQNGFDGQDQRPIGLPSATGLTAHSDITAIGSWNYVPDGGATLGLLGMGLAGLCALRRRFAS